MAKKKTGVTVNVFDEAGRVIGTASIDEPQDDGTVTADLTLDAPAHGPSPLRGLFSWTPFLDRLANGRWTLPTTRPLQNGK